MSLSSAEFAENTVLDFLIPHTSEVDIEDALGSSETARDVDDLALITSIPQRNLLFFGMTSALSLYDAMSYSSLGKCRREDSHLCRTSDSVSGRVPAQSPYI